jgi:hypothetical protein
MGLLSKILRWLRGSSKPQGEPALEPEDNSADDVDAAEEETSSDIVFYDENLFERARTQWQFGDWNSLADIERESLNHHPQRARLALLIASGHQQLGDMDATREFSDLAKEWGCTKKQVSQVLIAGVYNTLGKAASLTGNEQRALGHFEQSVRTAGDGGDVRLLAQARGGRQVNFGASKSLAISDTSDGEKDLVGRLLRRCLSAKEDVHEVIDEVLDENISNESAFDLLQALSDHYSEIKDRLTALHFLKKSEQYMEKNFNPKKLCALVERYIKLGQVGSAADIYFNNSLYAISGLLSVQDKEKVENFYNSLRTKEAKKTEHGHDLLLSYLSEHMDEYKKGELLNFVEIGSTREDVPGQGSTYKIASFCKKKCLHFISVDMDPHNARMAKEVFDELDTDFEAINMKGEDFLAAFDQSLNFVFLDAYDFDHGGHSDMRQSRYEKYLGSRINDEACHQMHLHCAEHIARKLTPDGLVCIDDTWLEDGRWTAKGTLAMPYLLKNGFQLLEVRNRAALLERSKGPNDE